MLNRTPPQMRRSLEAERFDVLVIGGGINGVAIARECALAGKRTLLVEQHDFGAGTTSRSTRIIHGGLRYLEHGEIGLVRESLRERQRMLQQHPHLVRPLHFLLALDQNARRSAMAIRAGLWLYRRLGGSKLRPAAGQQDEEKLVRWLDSGRQWSIFNYEDAQCEFPERLVADWMLEAADADAVARNYTQLLAVDLRHGRAQGALIRDLLTGKDERVEANWVINASGPWADRVCQRSGIRTHTPMIGGVRGSHIVLPRFLGAPDAAVYSEARDGRPVFVIPWNEQVLVGTTEVPDSGDPKTTEPSPDEIEYLLRALENLFPRAALTASDITCCWAGVRPLSFSPKAQPSDVPRRHYLHDHTGDGAKHMISVIGGKLSTASQLARECVAAMGISPATPSLMISEDDTGTAADQWGIEVAEAGNISEGSARAIIDWHGGRSMDIARLARGNVELQATLCPHTEHIVAEAMYALQAEYAVTLGDVLLRRVPVALGGCWSGECSRRAAHQIQGVMGWSDHQTAAALEAFEVERQAFLRKPAASSHVTVAASRE